MSAQEEDAPMEVEVEETTQKLSINLPIYEYVRDAQLQHGLKYDDHRQYRSYCSRRIHRIRRSLNVHQGIAPSAKARHQRGRKLMDISNAMVLDAGEKLQEYAERMLVIPLFLAERAWSYTMQLKQEVAECPRRRFHLVRRLEKAAQHATRFEKLCHDPESPCTERTKKEATAYAAYMYGLYKMEREKWAEARDDFYNCLVLYTTLCLSVKKDQVLEQYRLRLDELKASLRYCTFTLGEKPKEYKVKLPSTLQFHDIAFRHAKQIQEQELKLAAAVAAAAPVLSKKKAVETPQKAEPTKPQAPVATPSKTKTPPSQTKAKGKGKAPTPQAAAASPSKAPAVPEPVAKDEEEDEDEFEETREAMDEDQSEMSEEESDEDDKQQQSRGGGVTGLVKGWLGGAWS